MEQHEKLIHLQFQFSLEGLAQALERGLDPDILINDAAEDFAAKAKMHLRVMMTRCKVVAENFPSESGRGR